jgi:phage-related tail protein
LLKIDLHGFTYSKVEEILPNWLITNYNNGKDDFEIITGNSEQMKNLVKKLCNENGFIAVENFNGNSGALTIGINKI